MTTRLGRWRDAGTALATLAVLISIVLVSFVPRLHDLDARAARTSREREGLVRAQAIHAAVEAIVPLSGRPAPSARRLDAALARLGAWERERPLLERSYGEILAAWSPRDLAAPDLGDALAAAMHDAVERSRLDADEDPATAALAFSAGNRLTAATLAVRSAEALEPRLAATPSLPLRMELAATTARLRMLVGLSARGLDVATEASPATTAAISAGVERVVRAADAFVVAANDVARSPAPGRDTARLRASGRELCDALDAVTDAAFPPIARTLRARADEIARQRVALLAAMGLAFAVALLLGPAAVRGWRNHEDLRRARIETERLQAQVALARAEAGFRTVFEGAPLGIAVIALDGRLRDGNAALEAMFRAAPGALIGRRILDLTHPEDRDRSRSQLGPLVRGLVAGYQIEKRYLRLDGTTLWAEASVSTVTGNDGELLVITMIDDVSERIAMRERLVHEATHDALTGLPNRALFQTCLERALQSGGAMRCAVAFIDLDQFKDVNDSLGHATGDAVLRAVAARLSSFAQVFDGEAVARLGGDEFALLLCDGAGPASLAQRLELLLAAIAEPIEVGDQTLYTTASVGVAELAGYVEADDALRDADIALYRAKGSGRARLAIFDGAMRESAIRRLQLTSDLRGAIERTGELVIAFQPIVRLTDGRLRGYEALVRWQHPTRGLLAPDAFIPLAEQSGLIVPLGRSVMERAVARLAEDRRSDPELTLHVNVAVSELVYGDVIQTVETLLQRYAIPAEALFIEITEGAVVDTATGALAVLQHLRSLGVRICVDDFGVGYSSLRYLRSLPITGLKVDRSFVSGAGEGLASPPIVRMVLELGRSLALGVVAEGVETERQARELAELGCTCGQGFFFGAALPEPATA